MGPRMREDNGGKETDTGSPHARGQRGEGDGEWVRACARTTGGRRRRMGSRMCEDNGDIDAGGSRKGAGSPHTRGQRWGRVVGEPKVRGRKLSGMGFTPIPSTSSGQALTFPCKGGRGLQGTAKMGPRMREDNGKHNWQDDAFLYRVPACARTTGHWQVWARSGTLGPRMREDNGDIDAGGSRKGAGSPHTRGQRGIGKYGRALGHWVPACARTTAISMPVDRARALGPRIREDNGGEG